MSKSRFCPCLPGKCYSFLYPRHNYKGIPGKYEPRKLLVVSVRDLQKEALDASTAELNPTLIRGRWLVTGEDLDKGAERSFYVDSMVGIEPYEPPINSPAYVVVINDQVRFHTEDIDSAVAFRLGRQDGAIYGRLVNRFSKTVAYLLPRAKRLARHA